MERDRPRDARRDFGEIFCLPGPFVGFNAGMRRRIVVPNRRSIGVLVAACLLSLASDGAEKPVGYLPVTPARGLHQALQLQRNEIRDWLEQRDYPSTAEAVRCLSALTVLYGRQSGADAWQTETRKLHAAVDPLADAARRKSPADCGKGLQNVGGILDDLAKLAPAPPKEPDKDFQPSGGVKTWMSLMESAYRGARRADNARDVEGLSLALAEEANAAGYLRADARWRNAHHEVRDLALAASRLAKGDDLEPARQALKAVYKRCEACHDARPR